MKNLRLTSAVHKNQAIVKAHFAFDREIIALVRNLEGARWSQTLQSWYFPKADFNLNTLYQSCKGKVFIDYSRLKQASLPIKKNGFGTTKTYCKYP